MARKKKTGKREELSDAAVFERMQSILVNAAQGRRSVGDDRQYPELRRRMLVRAVSMPHLVSIHPTLDSFAAYINGIDDRSERVRRIREEFSPALAWSGTMTEPASDSSRWTGQQSRVARLKTVQTLLPLALAGVESMIATLSEPNPNGAPMLDERVEAVEHLRNLHRTLGELLSAVDAGHFEDELGQSLLAQAARFAKRTAKALRDDPMPYLSSALLLGVFEACGLPGIGGYLGGVALNIRKHGEKRPKG